MKVLRPIKPTSRAPSGNQLNSPSPSSTGQSRFFDDGKRRPSAEAAEQMLLPEQKTVGAGSKDGTGATNTSKSRASNPVGSASAFSWMTK